REASRVAAPEDPKAEQSLFDGIDTTWARFRGDANGTARSALDSLPSAFAAARAMFDPYAPEKTIPALARVQRLLKVICPSVPGPPCVRSDTTDLGASVEQAQGHVNSALVLAAGIAVEATAPRELWGTSQDIPAKLALYNRGHTPIRFASARFMTSGGSGVVIDGSVTIAPDSATIVSPRGVRFTVPSSPRWLLSPRRGAMYNYEITGRDEASYGVDALAQFEGQVGDAVFSIKAPVVYRFADQVLGEIRRPIAGVPDVSVLLDQELQYAPARAPVERDLRVQLRATSDSARTVIVKLMLPPGLIADSATRVVTLAGTGAPQTLAFKVRGQLPAGHHVIQVTASEGTSAYSSGYTTIDYEHINARRVYRPSRMSVEAVDVAAVSGMRVGYIAGVSDNSAAALEQLGIDVTQIDPATLANANLRGYSAIVIGPRAYETQPALVANNARVLDYARNGGTLVVQYGQYEMQQPGIMPYPITINRPHDRVTDENAPVKILDTTAAILRAPNRITQRDFDGWLQDRSLYMPRTFDPRYTPLLEMTDPGEQPNRGALLIAPLGQGTYVYTTLAFFRQLPNGVPGAARLFVNLLAAKTGRTTQ
ncbi:MAG TPA: hypothetical protein VNM36_06510, partial [Gemmatimonadaceae bacterium]|nr:hypothetical protein [Gemmatimonadaceae bacterium]